MNNVMVPLSVVVWPTSAVADVGVTLTWKPGVLLMGISQMPRP